jgi:hypothetical protein
LSYCVPIGIEVTLFKYPVLVSVLFSSLIIL